MPDLVNKQPQLTELEVEEIYEYMKLHATDDINAAWNTLFLRAPTHKEIDKTIQRVQKGGPVQHTVASFESRVSKIADSYRYNHGSWYNCHYANEIAEKLFKRGISRKEARAVRKAIKLPEPTIASTLYRYIVDEIKMIQFDHPNWSLDEAYENFVGRPPFPFETNLHEQ